MAEPFIGQLALFAFNFTPSGWAQCTGQLLPIRQYAALFAVLGTRFGGDGKTTFGLPNLPGSVPIGMGLAVTGTNYAVGEDGGEMTVSLAASTIPPHSHGMAAYNAAATTNELVANAAPAQAVAAGGHGGGSRKLNVYAAPTAGTTTSLAPASVTPVTSANAPHDNMQPTLTANWCIALEGIYPTRP